MLVRLLGAVEVAEGDGWVRAGHPKQACVLAALALSPGKLVPHEALVRRVWGVGSPPSARSIVYGHIARIRALFRDHPEASVARASSNGYRLDIPAERIDIFAMDGFKSRAEAAVDAGEHSRAARLWRSAAQLWRGEALSGIEGDWADRVRQKLDVDRLDVLGGLYDAELELGNHETIVSELARHAMRDPLAEQIIAPLMLTYYRCGRVNDALACFATARDHAREVLGAEPGGRVTELHRRILRDDPGLSLKRADPAPTGPVPLSQLPADTSVFAGREAELAAIRSLADGGGGGPRIAMVTGMAGIGKTALAKHAAWRLRDDFPDGQLFLDLHGYTKDVARVEPADALGRLLRNLGIAEADIPDNMEDRAAILRGALAHKRMVILLDNAVDEDQVRPLLPGGPDCLVIVTSRRQLLALDDAEPISLDVLGAGESARLFTEVSGLRDADAAAELAQLCGHLPLAIRIAGARLRGRPKGTVAELTSRLAAAAGSHLNALKLRGHSVKAAFDTSYEALDDDCRELFRLLSLLPGPGFHAAAAAALAGRPMSDIQWLLDDLVDDHLINRTAADRYEMHDLLWQYAHDRAAELNTVWRAEAGARLRSWYLHTAKRATDLLVRQDMALPIPDIGEDVNPAEFHDRTAAQAWIGVERSNLLAIADDVADSPFGEVAWHLADLLFSSLIAYADRDAVKHLTASGLRAAEKNGSRAGQARMWLVTAQYVGAGNDHEWAISCSQRALRIARESGEYDTETGALSLLSGSHWSLGILGRAEEYATRALKRSKARENSRQVANILNLLGMVCSDRGQLRRSIEYLDAAEQLMRELQHDYLHMVLVNKAEQYLALGRLATADDYSRAGLAIFERTAMTRFGGVHWALRARLLLARGRWTEAETHVRYALRHIEQHDDRGSVPYTLLTVAHVNADDPRTAITTAEDALSRIEALGLTSNTVLALVLVAEAQLRHGDHGRAETTARRALTLSRGHDFRRSEGLALTVLSEIEHAAANHVAAGSLAEQALRVHREVGARLDEARTRRVLADLGRADAVRP